MSGFVGATTDQSQTDCGDSSMTSQHPEAIGTEPASLFALAVNASLFSGAEWELCQSLLALSQLVISVLNSRGSTLT